MQKLKMTSIGMISAVIVSCSIFSNAFAELPQKFIDSTNAIIDTLRKRECVLKISSQNQSVNGKTVRIKQIRNDFGFGASIGKKWFDRTDSLKYGEAFRNYFEWATPENEMKWPSNEEADDYQDFELADSLISWCQRYDIKVRGHNLFWNERREWMPSWSLELSPAGFKQAMQRRIDGAVTHFKGKVAHWDVINEIVHYKDADGVRQITKPGLLAQLSGDTTIFSWIFQKARSIDSSVVMAVNEYSVIEKVADTKEYIEEIKDIEKNGGKIDIVGLEGHFDDYMERSSYMERIDTIARSIPHTMWLTEVDFTLAASYSERADKMEELMRSAFAYPRIGGLVLWAWWEGNQWKDGLSSFLVDSTFNETELGNRWRTVRNSWKTDTSGTVNSDGEFTFKGYSGKYEVSVPFGDSLYCDTFYLEPGQGKKSATVELTFSVGTRREGKKYNNGEKVFFNGKSITLPDAINPRELVLSVYTLSGRLIGKQPVAIRKGIINQSVLLPPGMHVIKLATKEHTIYSGIEFQL
jgi:GH35 family endo-1,4-beta-xylanase